MNTMQNTSLGLFHYQVVTSQLERHYHTPFLARFPSINHGPRLCNSQQTLFPYNFPGVMTLLQVIIFSRYHKFCRFVDQTRNFWRKSSVSFWIINLSQQQTKNAHILQHDRYSIVRSRRTCTLVHSV